MSNWTDECFSSLTIEECKKFFNLYENDVDQVTDNKDKLSLLRSCIELLNRLENTNEDLFAGKVLIFLAKAIPLFDQSGVNSKSDFNIKRIPRSVTRNLQIILEKNAAKDQQLSQMIERDMEEGETISDDDSSENAPAPQQDDEDKLFERFWRMQQYFYQPNLIYDKKSWFTFHTQLSSFVSKMEQPTNTKAWNLKSSYMTEPRSLCLQLNDINMRRCFLVQILIILQYLELPVDTRPSDLALEKMQLDWASKLTKKIYNILDTLPNQQEGRRFLGLVRHILKGEEMWNRWKNDKCKEPKFTEEDDEMVMMGSTYHKRRKISDELSSAKPSNWHVIGSHAMSRLWNMKQDQKFNQPDLATYLNIPVERQSESFKDPNYSFRLLRLLRRSPDFFTQTTHPIQSLDEYLKTLAKNSQNEQRTTNSTASNLVSNASCSNMAAGDTPVNGAIEPTINDQNNSQVTNSDSITNSS